MPAKTQRFETRQHMKNNTFEIFRYRDDYPKEVALHHHDFYEIYLFLTGNVNYTVESRNYHLAPGDMLLISPMELHQPTFGVDNHNYERIVVWIDKSYLEQYSHIGVDLTTCFNTQSAWHNNLIRLDSTTQQVLSYYFEQLIKELQKNR